MGNGEGPCLPYRRLGNLLLIAQISDTHILARGADHPSADLRARWLSQCVADINTLHPHAVVFTGDTVQQGQHEEYLQLRDLLAPLDVPLYPVPGNRDDRAGLRLALGDHYDLPGGDGFIQYVVETHDVRLVAIDSTAPGERKGRFCPFRQQWLDRVLGEQPDRPTVLFTHHPPFDVDDHYIGGYRHPEEATAFTDVVSDHSQVTGLLCGHVHWPVERWWAGTEARIMPSVAVDLRKGVDETVARERPIYMLHELSGEKGIVSQARVVGA